DDGIRHRLAQVLLGIALQLAEDAGRDLLRRVLLAVDLGGPVGAHVSLDGCDGAVDVGDRLALRGLADEGLAVLGECDDGWGGAEAFGVRDDGGFSTFKYRHHRVGGSQVDSYCSSHARSPSMFS